MSNCAGVCLVGGDFRLEYQVIALEYIPNKLISIEAVCLRPSNHHLDKEVIFKLSTKNLFAGDKKLEIAFSIINSVIKEVGLSDAKLHKLCIRDKKVFFIITA